ncbi:sulfurtransferase-like selenium metabolism protein YedF [Geomesophilobacter sediminis]|uniref:Sulfurtransferase-like selenium metabolism protein YedF n=1 Tax=Geomesophilobacter sediminis TaxID=2798584 RepID=A0A8J7S7N8_9BACT|nr:sulfurtransferase-like selenium metabolism protein YedF [Geomesophilobacter sediminis]MBJ6727042.1 sulfurtransferase-like selenium metabolism protein YedF [Geomesophilobacter sediminis]
MKDLDVRGQACPLPVVAVKKALDEGGPLRVLLDDGAPRENVRRFAENRGFSVAEAPCEGGYAFTITGSAAAPAPTAPAPSGRGTVMLIGTDRLGDGPEELGRLLMKNFIMTLVETSQLPDRMYFVNTGVLLTAEGSEVIEALTALGNRGVEVASCGICLDFFQKKDKLAAGIVTNMLTIAESLVTAGSVVRI